MPDSGAVGSRRNKSVARGVGESDDGKDAENFGLVARGATTKDGEAECVENVLASLAESRVFFSGGCGLWGCG